MSDVGDVFTVGLRQLRAGAHGKAGGGPPRSAPRALAARTRSRCARANASARRSRNRIASAGRHARAAADCNGPAKRLGCRDAQPIAVSSSRPAWRLAARDRDEIARSN